MRSAWRGMLATVGCLSWEKKPSARQGRGAKNAEDRPLHRQTHYGAGKLHALQGDGMEAGAASGWRGGQSGGGLRLRDGKACVARDGARKNPEALRALRF